MGLYLTACLLPGLVVLLAAPLTMGKVPPNQLYGFRTPKTRSSPAIWYPANRFAGWAMMAAGLLTLFVNLILWRTNPDWPAQMLVRWMAIDLVVWILLASVASLAYLRKL